MSLSPALFWPLELAVPIGLQGVSVVTDARGYSNFARGQQNTLGELQGLIFVVSVLPYSTWCPIRRAIPLPQAPGLCSFLVSTQPTAKTPWSGVSNALWCPGSRAEHKAKEQPRMNYIHSVTDASYT